MFDPGAQINKMQDQFCVLAVADSRRWVCFFDVLLGISKRVCKKYYYLGSRDEGEEEGEGSRWWRW